MGKKIELEFGRYFYDKKLIPLRDKVDLIRRLVDTILYIYANTKVEKDDVKGKIIISVEKMNRIFYEYDDKIVSFAFPFMLVIENEEVIFEERNTRIVITTKILSRIKGLLETKVFNQDSFIDYYDILDQDEQLNCSSEVDANDMWKLLNKLLLHECGYIRYDYDNDVKRADALKHPVHHLDVNYSNYGTYKIGLKKGLKINEFMELIDIQSNCYFLNNITSSNKK